jgi:hypothetical protein
MWARLTGHSYSESRGFGYARTHLSLIIPLFRSLVTKDQIGRVDQVLKERGNTSLVTSTN